MEDVRPGDIFPRNPKSHAPRFHSQVPASWTDATTRPTKNLTINAPTCTNILVLGVNDQHDFVYALSSPGGELGWTWLGRFLFYEQTAQRIGVNEPNDKM